MFRNVNSLGVAQMYKTAETLGMNDFWEFWIPNNRFMRLLCELRLLLKLFFILRRRKLTFTIFDFRNSFMQSLRRHFRASKFTLIDDGFYTYVAYQKYMSKGFYLPTDRYTSLRGKLVAWIYFAPYYGWLTNRSFEVYSIYANDIGVKNFALNNLNRLKTMANNKQTVDEDVVYFAGTRLVERGAVTLEEELKLTKELQELWSKQNKKMIYVGKRSTSKSKLNAFEKAGIPVLQFDLPLEIVLLQSQKIPYAVCSLGSTLDKTLPTLFPNLKTFYVDATTYFGNRETLEVLPIALQYANKSKLKSQISVCQKGTATFT